MDSTKDQVVTAITAYLPKLLGAVVILVVGWLLALAISAGIRAVLKRTSVDERVAGWLSGDQSHVSVENVVGKTFFYLVLLVTVVAALQTLGLTLVTQPLNTLLDELLAYGPQLLGAAALTLVAVLVASVLRFLTTRALGAARVDERLSAEMRDPEAAREVPISRSLAESIYWLTILLFLPAILGTLGLTGLLEPVQGVVDKLLGALPNIFAAAVLFVVGWFVARVVQRLTTSLLASIGTDRLADRIGVAEAFGRHRLSSVLGTLFYALILIPVIVSALNALQLEAVTAPASRMLATILGAIPSILSALVILGIGYVLGRVIAGVLSNILAGMGFNSVTARLGLPQSSGESARTPSELVGLVVLAGILLFSFVEAADVLGFDGLSIIMLDFTAFAGHVLMGLIILGFGLFLATFASRTIASSKNANAGVLANVARVGIWVLAGAMALREMGFASDIINMAFGLMLGAIAVAAAIAFGLGGREWAERRLASWAARSADDRR